MTIKLIRLITILLISAHVLALGGCASGIVDPVPGSPTVADAYGAAMHSRTTFIQGDEVSMNSYQQNSNPVPHRGMQLPVLPTPTHSRYLRLEKTLNAQCPTLPNPKSVMYVFGHYAGSREIPVAGHFVPFSLYTRTYYALPNDVLTPYNDGQFSGLENGDA